MKKIENQDDGQVVVADLDVEGKPESTWTCSDPLQAAKMLPTWQGGAVKSRLPAGEVSALQDRANELLKQVES